MEIQDLYNIFIQSKGITTDTRKVSKGQLFFALKGERFNANYFAIQALEKGARWAIVDEVIEPHNQLIQVEDVLKTLQNLANYHRRQFDIPVLALTGSNGKTTTKELLNQVLSLKFKVHFTKGNLNNHIGVPLTLLEMPLDTELAIIEMGANHQKEIKFLCEIAEPNYGLVTNIGKAHLEGFGGEEGVKKGKGELYQFLAKNQGFAFANQEEQKVLEIAEICEHKSIYNSESIKIKNAGANPFLKILVENKETITTQMVGQYNYPNVLTALAVGQFFNIDVLDAVNAIADYIPNNNRSQIVIKETNTIVLDAYNANPTSMKAAITNFKQMKGDYKIVILGDMLELGNDSQKEHSEIVDLVNQYQFDEVFWVGNQFSLLKNIKAYKKVDDITINWKNYKNCLFLIKGSRGIKLETLLSKES